MKRFLKSAKGFTLIELLIVIAVLGVLASVVLVAIDPVEQLARGRDSGRKTSVAAVGHALGSYFVANSVMPAVATWSTDIVNAGDLKQFPAAPSTAPAAGNTGACTGGGIGGGWICYKFVTTNYILYTHLESKVEQRKGTCAGVGANTWYVYSSADGKSGTFCGAEGAIPAAGTVIGAGLLP